VPTAEDALKAQGIKLELLKLTEPVFDVNEASKKWVEAAKTVQFRESEVRFRTRIGGSV
jgi:hypothetical protein